MNIRAIEVPGLPLPAGSSPFRIKGSIYAGALSRSARELPGGLGRLAVELGDPELRAFFGGIFLASAWYDALPVVPLSATLARVRGRELDDELTREARCRAMEDIRGVYRALLRAPSAEEVAPRLVRGFHRYFSFGHAENEEVRPGRLAVVAHGIPGYLARFYTVSAGEFCRVTLELAGGRDVRLVASEAPAGSGELEPVTVRTRVSWS